MRLLIKLSRAAWQLGAEFWLRFNKRLLSIPTPVSSVHLHRTLLLLQFGHQLPLLLRQQLLQVSRGLRWTVVRRPGSLRGWLADVGEPSAKRARTTDDGPPESTTDLEKLLAEKKRQLMAKLQEKKGPVEVD